jgi:chromate transporter
VSPVAEVASVFLKLGCTSFGGPVAHLGYFRAELVEKRGWIDDDRFADLVALCQFLPGPASSQLVFALGMQRAGLAGAMVGSLCFTLPSALLMIAFAYGVSIAGNLHGAGWIHGLKLAAVGVVAQAVLGMAKSLSIGRARIVMTVLSAAAIIAMPGALTQIAVLVAGGVAGVFLYRDHIAAPASSAEKSAPGGHLIAALALSLFGALLLGLPALASVTGSREVAVFDSFYRAGSLVFGGGHVVLPLLRAEVVPRGWVTDDQFLAGYGAAQAIPGPLFSFSAFLGASMTTGPAAFGMGLLCLFGIFVPAWLLIGGSLPFWHSLRSKRWAQAALAGANASVVGVLLAALYDPVITESVRGPLDVAAALVAFGALHFAKAPPWAVVLGMAGIGAVMG